MSEQRVDLLDIKRGADFAGEDKIVGQCHVDGRHVIAAGAVIARQPPGTALGFIFLSMEDETGICNIVIHPHLYEREKVLITRGKFLKVYGKLQNQDGVVHVKAEALELLQATAIEVRSHDFH